MKADGDGKSASRHGDYVPWLDVVRFLAAGIVIVFHFAFWSWHDVDSATGFRALIGTPIRYPELVDLSWWGWVGVEIFFVISGFVIAISADGRSSSRFLRSRLLRLAPALWFFSTLALLVTFVFLPVPVSEALLLYAKSIVLFPKGPWIDNIHWSLTIEIVFYSLIFLLLLLGRFEWLTPLTYAWGAITFSFFLICLLDLWIAFPDQISSILHFVRNAYPSRLALLTTGPYFVVGLAIYLIYRKGITGNRALLFVTSLLAGEIGIYFNAEKFAAATNLEVSPFVPCLVWTLAVTVIAISIFLRKRQVDLASAPRLFRSLGLTTYPLYLIHYVSGALLLGILLNSVVNQFLALTIAILVCVFASYLFATYLEPAIRRSLAIAYDRAVAAITVSAQRSVKPHHRS